MSATDKSFQQTLIWLWLRLVTIAAIALLLAIVPQLHEKVIGWPFFLTPAEVAFEVAIYVVFVALSGAVLGTLCTAAIAPFLLRFEASRARISVAATRIAVAAAVFLDFRILLGVVLLRFGLGIEGRRAEAILALFYVGFTVALWLPRSRKQVLTSLDTFLEEKPTRRAVLGIGVASAAVVTAELAIRELAGGKTASAAITPVKAAARPTGPNILLITFDALAAEDMSLYGHRLRTTPHIDEFARKSTVFTNFYSASTFTTPSVASVITGLYPSEHHVYHLQGRLRGGYAEKTLPRAMRQGGYKTGASISSPFVYFLNEGIAADYDILPEVACDTGGFLKLWNATAPLHQRMPFGSRAREFEDLRRIWEYVPAYLEEHAPGRFARGSAFPASGSFTQARQVIDQLPEGSFMWVHVMAPHGPYLPDSAHAGRFLPTGELRTETAQEISPSLTYNPAEQQPLVDKLRLRYDEFIADADDAFGAFISGLESSGRLRNTAVIVAADHGESFEGGLLNHAHYYQTRPQLHIPLIVRLPGQENGHTVHVTADQTALAPTVLEIAGLPRPAWMRGQSLVSWLNQDGEGAGHGMAFTQYFATNSQFKPLTKGTVSVIDGTHQSVIELATGNGILRSLAEAHSWNRDRSAENPALAQRLREAIYSRFPQIPRKSA
jgi:arylsulfatase A-like enzyme